MNMVKVVVGNNVHHQDVVVNDGTTLRAVLDAKGVDYTRGTMHLDGSTISAGGLDKTFADYGIKEKCFLLNVVNADNA